MWLMLFLLFFSLVIGVPVGSALGASSAVYLVFFTNLDPSLVTSSFFEYLSSYTFMAIPFFMLAGTLMEHSGLMGQIFDFFDAVLGWIKGGLGAACFVTSAVLAALTGSSVASASTLSVIAIPRMNVLKYPIRLSTGIVCTGGTLAGLIPPSIWLIIFGVMTNTSVAKLFFAGVMPGLLLTFFLVALSLFFARNTDVVVIPFNKEKALANLKGCIAGLMLPVVVLGGLYSGIFTPTESGAVACAYGLIYGFSTQRGHFFKPLWEATGTALKLSTMVFFLMGGVGILQIVSANEFWPQKLAQFAISFGLTPLQFLLTYTASLLILGCFIDGASMILLTTPVAFPVSQALGIDPLLLAIVVVIACQLGCVTPPVGVNLYAISGITGIPINDIFRGSLPFLILMILFILLLIAFPAIVTFFPGILFRPVVFGGV